MGAMKGDIISMKASTIMEPIINETVAIGPCYEGTIRLNGIEAYQRTLSTHPNGSTLVLRRNELIWSNI